MAYVSTAQVIPAALLERCKETLAGFGEQMIKRRIYRTTLQELQNLQTRDLDDLGINRTEIRRVAWEAAYGIKSTI